MDIDEGFGYTNEGNTCICGKGLKPGDALATLHEGESNPNVSSLLLNRETRTSDCRWNVTLAPRFLSFHRNCAPYLSLHRTVEARSKMVYAVAWSPHGKSLATGGWDNTIKVWDTEDWAVWELSGPRGLVLSLAFSPHGNLLCSGSADRTVRLWGMRDEFEPRQLRFCYAQNPSAALQVKN